MGNLVVISAPSGSGKTTIARAILDQHPDMLFSVSATTRPKRNGEQEGKDYFFLTKEEFQRRVAAKDLVEWEEIYGDYYGTLRSEVDRAIRAGRTMLFDIDVKGGLSIKRAYGGEALLVYIQPPSPDALRERLTQRNTEDQVTIRRRMERVPMELELGAQFDIRVVNDDLKRAIAEVMAAVRNHVGLPA